MAPFHSNKIVIKKWLWSECACGNKSQMVIRKEDHKTGLCHILAILKKLKLKNTQEFP